MLIKSCPKLRPAESRRRRPRDAGCCEGGEGAHRQVNWRQTTESGAGCAITRPRRHPAIRWPPRLERSAVSESEAKALELYRERLKCAEGHSVVIEEDARQMVYAEELHASEVNKMRREPDKVAAFRPVEHLPGNCVWTADPESDFSPCSVYSLCQLE
jgi:hypothetical protein